MKESYILEENDFCQEQDIQDIIYEVGQDFHQFINKDLILGPKSLFLKPQRFFAHEVV